MVNLSLGSFWDHIPEWKLVQEEVMMALAVLVSVALMVARGDSVAGLRTGMVVGVGGVYWPLIQLEMCGIAAILIAGTLVR